MATTREIVGASTDIVKHYQLTDTQIDALTNSDQCLNIIGAAVFNRWDQVTIMLIQEKIIEKWPI